MTNPLITSVSDQARAEYDETLAALCETYSQLAEVAGPDQALADIIEMLASGDPLPVEAAFILVAITVERKVHSS